MKRPKTIQAELHLIEAMLNDLHPTVQFSPGDNAILLGAAIALRWAIGDRKNKRVTRLVVPRRRRVPRRAH